MTEFSALFYRYKDRGVVERDGRRYKKYVKVPVVRSRHWQAAAFALLLVAGSAAMFAVVRRLAERPPRAEAG